MHSHLYSPLLVAAPAPPPLWQRRHADSSREREILVQRAAHLLEVADSGGEELDDGEVATVSVRLADDALAALLLQHRGGGHVDSLRSLCRRLRTVLDLPSHGGDVMQTKLHLVAALQQQPR